MNETRLTFSRR